MPAFVAMGVDTVRITGGEPLLRPRLPQLVAQLKALGLKVGLSTNAEFLEAALLELKQVGIDGINISLDTLNPVQLQKISRSQALPKILAAIDAALALGIPVKTNTVVMKGINENQIVPILEYAARTGFEPRFLEFMKIGPLKAQHAQYFLAADEMLQAIEHQHGRIHQIPVEIDSTAIVFGNSVIPRFGIIASESYPFCGNCSRLRLTATGKLYGCMMHTHGIDLKAYLRWTPEQIPCAIAEAVGSKPLQRIVQGFETMNVLGG